VRTNSSRPPRAAIVVTGSELVRGQRTDRNGPFLARELLERGLEPDRIIVVGDREEELESALLEALRADLCVISGGLGPTHDDRTVELLARAAGRSLAVVPEIEHEIEEISRNYADRMRRPYADFEVGVRKQATLPEGAVSLGLAGTAPGVLLEVDGRVAVALPGPPPELQRLWRNALQTEPVQRVLARAHPPGRRILRLFGVGESSVARALAEAGGDGDGVEATICVHDFEIQVDLFVQPEAEERGRQLAEKLAASLERYVFARDERPVEELVLGLCRARGLSLAAAESCTGGLVAARLTSVPGASETFLGSMVVYSDNMKHEQLGVPEETLREYGAVSAETAAAMTHGARKRLGADVAVSVTGIAGPTRGPPEKPGGRVHIHAEAPDGEIARELDIPGGRESVRQRSTATALHLLRRLLARSGDISA
jgi:nicotinamide-nucleotide amidase